MYQINTAILETRLLELFSPAIACTFAHRIQDTLSRNSAWVKITPEEASKALTKYWLKGEHVYDTHMGKYKSKELLDGSILFLKKYESKGSAPVKGWGSRVIHFLKKDYVLNDAEIHFILSIVKDMIKTDLDNATAFYLQTKVEVHIPAIDSWAGYGIQ